MKDSEGLSLIGEWSDSTLSGRVRIDRERERERKSERKREIVRDRVRDRGIPVGRGRGRWRGERRGRGGRYLTQNDLTS